LREGLTLKRSIILFLAIALLLRSSGSDGAELRTYRFIPDGSLPYSASCGECALPYLGATSDIAGTFTLSLDFLTSTGTLVDLDENLVNYFNILASSAGPTLDPAPAPYPTIVPPWASDPGLPLTGSIDVTGFDAFVLSSDELQLPYSVAVAGDQAKFSMTVPISDFFITVTDAMAVQVPEPTSILIAVFAGFLLVGRR
jgi:hypothetical protein